MFPRTSDNYIDDKEWEILVRAARQYSVQEMVGGGVPFMLGLLFYGGYLVLYGITLNVIIKRKRDNYWINIITITSLFIVATTGVVFNTMAYTLQIASELAFLQLKYDELLAQKTHILSYKQACPFNSDIFGDNILFLENATQVCLVIASALTDGILVRSQSLLHSKSKASIRYGDATSSGTGDT
ncbi:hypothetical protein L218DRAFT_1002890 [Marasmius fiardii PR-910]|nr:hypothetical protein L218DRAFT_1002890 [Marasmius fiardii PR-910]